MRRFLLLAALLALLAVPSRSAPAPPSDVYVALASPIGATPSAAPPDTVLHVLGALAQGWDPVKEGLKLPSSTSMITTLPDALMRLGGGDPAQASYFGTPTRFYWIAVGPDGRHLLAATDRSSIQVYTLSPRPVLERTLHVQPPSIITSLRVAPTAAYATCVSGDGTSRVVVMDPNGGEVRATWTWSSKGPMFASDLCASPDGRRVYVTLFGKRGLRGPGQAVVAALDASTGAPLARGVTGAEPMGVVCPPDGRVLVTNMGTASVTEHDPVTLAVTRRVQVGLRPTRVVADRRRAYISCSGDDRVYVLDLASGGLRPSIEVDRQPLGLALRGDGHLLVGCVGTRTICDVDTEAGTVTSRTSPQPQAAPYGIAVGR